MDKLLQMIYLLCAKLSEGRIKLQALILVLSTSSWSLMVRKSRPSHKSFYIF